VDAGRPWGVIHISGRLGITRLPFCAALWPRKIASWLSLFVLLGVMAVSQDRNLLRQDLQNAAERMLWIFLSLRRAGNG